jgi:hypothetical protein
MHPLGNINSGSNKARAMLARSGYAAGGKVTPEVTAPKAAKFARGGAMSSGANVKPRQMMEDFKSSAPRLDKMARGGRTKAKTTVNVIVAPQAQRQPMPATMPPMQPPPQGAPPPMGGMPGMGMKRGGRMNYLGPHKTTSKDDKSNFKALDTYRKGGRVIGGGKAPVPMDAGAGGGKGRLEKAKDYGGKKGR